MKQSSFHHAKDVLCWMTSVMSLFRASAAVILAPLGMLPSKETFDLQFCKCWSMSKLVVASESALEAALLLVVIFLQVGHVYIRNSFNCFFLILTQVI